MSASDRGGGPRRHDPRRGGDPSSVYEPADESAASVFGAPAPRAPAPPPPAWRPAPPDPGGWPPPPAPSAYGSGGVPPAPGRSPAYGGPETRVYGEPLAGAAPGAWPPAGHGGRSAAYEEPAYEEPARRPARAPRRDGPPRAPTSERPAGPAGDRGRAGGRGFPLGLGALVGFAGLACFLAALLVLPWFTAAGQDVTLSDMRSAFTLAETDPDDLLPSDGEQAPDLTDGVPTPDEVGEAVEQQARSAAAQAAASALDSGRARYLELYTDVLWLVLAVAVSLAVVLSTVLSPRSAALSLLLGFRRLAGAVTVLAGIAHGAALWVVFTGDGAPSPATGVWIGAGGLAAVLLGCIIGPKG